VVVVNLMKFVSLVSSKMCYCSPIWWKEIRLVAVDLNWMRPIRPVSNVTERALKIENISTFSRLRSKYGGKWTPIVKVVSHN
jgi:hypothetical protein